MVLFINACVRNNSRTKILADHLLSKFSDEIQEVILENIDFPEINGDFISKREKYEAASDFDHSCFDLAKQFACADEIVIAAPFWDLSFPASLKRYFEMVNAIGITFGYTAEGMPYGMCRAKTVYYVSTSGGTYFPQEFGYGYVKVLSDQFYGISDVRLIKAVGLDVEGADEDMILGESIKYIDGLFCN